MKTLKNQIVIIGLFFLNLLAIQPLLAIDPDSVIYVVLTPDTIEDIVAHVVDKHGQGQGPIFRIEVYDFLADQLNTKGEAPFEQACDYLRPKLIGGTIGRELSFSWNTGLQSDLYHKYYKVNLLNLSTFDRREELTEKNQITLKLDNAFFILSFTTNCGPSGFTSPPSIVIADKDILFSEIPVRQNEGIENIANWSVSPNPFSQEIAIQMQATKAERLLISLYDLNGRIVKNVETVTTIDPQSFFLSTNDLANGFYTLSIQTPTEHLQQKLIKTQ